MVLKLRPCTAKTFAAFESSVNSDGTQTLRAQSTHARRFESSVNSDGTQTFHRLNLDWLMFESSVNSDGTQTEYRGVMQEAGSRAV